MRHSPLPRGGGGVGGGGCQACEFTRITDMGNLQPILGDVVASLAPRQRGIHGGGALLKGGGVGEMEVSQEKEILPISSARAPHPG